MTTTEKFPPDQPKGLPSHEARLSIARRLAGWELGDRHWADRIIGAYLSPEATAEYLDREGA